MNKSKNKNTTYYILMSCTERDIYAPQLFNSLKEAQKKMKDEILEQLGSFANYTKNEDYGLSRKSAWANVHDNSDWAIFKLSINDNKNITVFG